MDMATINDEALVGSITVTDDIFSTNNITDDSLTGSFIFDGLLTPYEDTNINVFLLASLPLNDIIPYDIIGYGSGVTDESGTATNITDD